MKQVEIQKNVYYDSVSLMLITRDIKAIKGINEANICMGTDHNKELLESVGLLTDESKGSKPNDLIIALDGDKKAIEEAKKVINDAMNKKKQTSKTSTKFTSLKKAITENEDSNFVIISVAGQYAAYEAETALNHNKHVMLFSDNVSLEEELHLKKLAHDKKLLMMGPDCGTAIINGKPLGFANKVKAGSIGIVGASGTGIQEVSTLIDKLGFGLTQAIGTGGRDLSKDIGGIMMSMGIDALAEDPNTKVIVLVSKPPHHEVTDKIIAKAKKIKKPFVINFLGESREATGNITFSATLEETANTACCLLDGGDKTKYEQYGIEDMFDYDFLETQKYLRALYSGGTLCDESMLLSVNKIGDIYSNTPVKGCLQLENPLKSHKNTFIDLGDDFFTKGKPHPMIEPETRNQRILTESKDPEVAIILLDFVLGYGAHKDPVGATIPFIKEARKNNTNLCFIASITGTIQDPQNMDKQAQLLLDNGVILASCNAKAAQLATSIIKEINK